MKFHDFHEHDGEWHQESGISEKEQLLLVQHKLGSLSSEVHVEAKQIVILTKFLKWTFFSIVINLILLGYLIIFHLA
tara:strand:+ start:356 stop:586 length:231 start_codon:yes stop_codon:yes gene_type:complete